MKILELTDEEAAALYELIDAGNRHLGVRGAPAAARLAEKLQNAPSEYPKPKEDSPPENPDDIPIDDSGRIKNGSNSN